MKPLLSAVLCRWLAPTLLGLAIIAPLPAATPMAERTLQGDIAPTTRTVRIDHRSGPVTIVGVDSGFGWTWTMSCDAETEARANDFLKACEMDVKETSGTLQMDLLLPDRSDTQISHSLLGLLSWTRHENFSARSALELRLPRAVAVELKNRFGSSTLTGLSGTINIEGQNGRLDLRDLTGVVDAGTSFASVHAEHLAQARLRNQNGNIDVADVEGDLRVTTSFGSMQVRRVKGRVDLKNQNGNVEVEDVNGRLLAATSFSKMTVRDVTGDADLKNQNGSIEARAISGDVVAETSFAALRVTDVGGKASLRCQNGRIEATRVGNDLTAANTFGPLRAQEIHGRADLQSQNGEVVASQVDGDLRAKTSFARMELDASGKRIDAQNKNGSVQITARSPAVERIAATASFAPIDLRLAADLQPVIRASTSFGKVRSDFPVLLADSMADAKFYGSAGPKIDLRGQNGDIRIQSLAGR